MTRRLVLVFSAISAVALLGIGVAAWSAARGMGGWFSWKRATGGDAPGGKPAALAELQAKRDHVALVISGRLMAEIYPCG